MLISNGTEQHYPLSELLSITSSADDRKDLWDGKVTLGIDINSGNVNQLDYLANVLKFKEEHLLADLELILLILIVSRQLKKMKKYLLIQVDLLRILIGFTAAQYSFEYLITNTLQIFSKILMQEILSVLV